MNEQRDYFVDTLKPLGPEVAVEWTTFDGDKVIEHLPALVAVDTVMFGALNGVKFRSARIHWGQWLDVYSASGGGFAAEYGLLKLSE